eukprot:1525085-Rhodomonas_salina.1
MQQKYLKQTEPGALNSKAGERKGLRSDFNPPTAGERKGLGKDLKHAVGAKRYQLRLQLA